MGIHNKDTSNLPGKLKSCLCPYCGRRIRPSNHIHGKLEIDCYDFVCDQCNPSINICLAGSCFPLLQLWEDFEKKGQPDPFKLKRIHQSKIKNAKGLIVVINSSNFK